MAKILLVEDNEINRDMLSYRLNRRGYKVLLAVDGLEAVSLATKENPDLILMDLSLPVMDGWDATRKIKDNPDTTHIPVIALTAHAMSGDRQKAIAAGCDDYETKPIEFARLEKKMKNLLERILPSPSQEVTPQSEIKLKEQKIKSKPILEQSKALNLEKETQAIISPSLKREKLWTVDKTINLVYSPLKKNLWKTGRLVKVSSKVCEIESKTIITIELKEIKIRLWNQNFEGVSNEILGTFLEMSQEDNKRFFVELTANHAIITILLHQLISRKE